MNDKQIDLLLRFLHNPSFQVWYCCAGEWMRFNRETILANVDGLPEYKAFTTQGSGKYIDLYNVDIDDLCITRIVSDIHSTLSALGN